MADSDMESAMGFEGFDEDADIELALLESDGEAEISRSLKAFHVHSEYLHLHSEQRNIMGDAHQACDCSVLTVWAHCGQCGGNQPYPWGEQNQVWGG